MEFNATFLVSAISFLVFVYLMNKIFYAPLESIITEREKLVDDTLNDAKKSRAAAAELLQDRELKLNQAFEESRKLINGSVEAANIDSKEKTSQAKADSINSINTQKIDLDKQKEFVNSQLDSAVDELANLITSKILG